MDVENQLPPEARPRLLVQLAVGGGAPRHSNQAPIRAIDDFERHNQARQLVQLMEAWSDGKRRCRGPVSKRTLDAHTEAHARTRTPRSRARSRTRTRTHTYGHTHAHAHTQVQWGRVAARVG